jgi:Recombinase zinc beta ribbon domain
MATRFGGGRAGGPAPVAYSPYFLAGLLRCAECGARMHAQTSRRRKGDSVYAYPFYVCGFAKDKGPAVCGHRAWYARDFLEDALITRLREATTPVIVEAIARAVNDQLDGAVRARDARVGRLKLEALRLETEAGNLVRVLAGGFDSPAVRAELEATEAALRSLRADLADHDQAEAPALRVHPEWVRARIEHLDKLLSGDPARARFEVAKHLDGDMTGAPLPDCRPGRGR